MEKVIITAAVTGSRPTKKMNPAVPYSPEEIAGAAIGCYRAGAAIAHIHVRDPITGVPNSSLDLFQQVVSLIRKECDILLNLTTSGLHLTGDDIFEQRLGPVALQPELCSLDVGSMNFQDRAFINPPEWGTIAAAKMRDFGVKPELEVFDIGHIYQAIDLIERGLIVEPPYFQLCMGIKWGISATVENLEFMKSKLPAHALWSVLGIGAAQLEMITQGILLGGNVRVGFEDNLYLRKGVPADSNAQFVEMACDLAQRIGREVATPKEAREILGLPT
jgi:3-keto-5-aminohexanoate cleavage enzyme